MRKIHTIALKILTIAAILIVWIAAAVAVLLLDPYGRVVKIFALLFLLLAAGLLMKRKYKKAFKVLGFTALFWITLLVLALMQPG